MKSTPTDTALPVLAHEDRGAFLRLRDELLAMWEPVNEQERLLVEQMAEAEWRQQRAARLKTALADTPAGARNVQRYAAQATSSYKRALQTLLQLQADRQQKTSVQ